jgi:hypothetical protein
MATSNEYAKQYKTMRRSIIDEPYNLILFPEDNTISVVKAKCVQPSERPNFVSVTAGNKIYNGFLLHEGKQENFNCLWSLSDCHVDRE